MHDEKYLLVVGDKFSAFAANPDTITLSQLRGLLALPQLVIPHHHRIVLVPGQGLGESDMSEVAALAERSPHAGEFDLDLWRARSPRADGRRSHKHQAANTVISAPRRLAEDTFELDLLVDEDCELMADHQTGQHLQGMLLIEAARQSFLAVTEMFYLPDDGTRYYFVFDDLSARYKRFVFPVDARLVYQVRNIDPTPGRQRFTVDVTVEQCGDEAAVISGTFTVVKDARITRMEAGLAREAVSAHVTVAARARASLRSGVSEAA